VFRDRLILFNKPYQVLCKFSDSTGRSSLAEYISLPGIYPAGRLDYDSEGLVLLTNVGWLQHRISDPHHKLPKTYWVQVEGIPEQRVLQILECGIEIKDGPAMAIRAEHIPPPAVWPRTPPIRQRRFIPTAWLVVTLTEGRKRQVRRMTAAMGFPTLRLIRISIGPWQIGDLQPGQWVEVDCPKNFDVYESLLSRSISYLR
jgi:23S rRNA pseudouridine2457 synthase